ncbi:hypothetical protein BRD17_03765 [Halobacteriales archaeon SW_7_68_16]|nr:MAG: hypothetical protein BRD17_03765 [Halobacteriales archaeon SW_7_68_16]
MILIAVGAAFMVATIGGIEAVVFGLLTAGALVISGQPVTGTGLVVGGAVLWASVRFWRVYRHKRRLRMCPCCSHE